MDISGYLLLFKAFAPDFKAGFVEYSSLLSHGTNSYKQFTGKVDDCIHLSNRNFEEIFLHGFPESNVTDNAFAISV